MGKENEYNQDDDQDIFDREPEDELDGDDADDSDELDTNDGEDDAEYRRREPKSETISMDEFKKLKSKTDEMEREREEYKKKLQESTQWKDDVIRALQGKKTGDSEEDAKNEKIKQQFAKVFGEKALKRLTGEEDPMDDPNYVSFINKSRQASMKTAESLGFKDRNNQLIAATVGDAIIHSHEPWAKRFYEQRDDTVLTEVAEYMEKNFLGEYRKKVEADLIARIKRSGLGAVTMPSKGSGGSRKKGGKRKPVDLNDPNAKMGLMRNIAGRALARTREAGD